MGLSTLKIRCQESATLLYVRTYVYWYHTKQRPGTSRSLYVAKQGVSCLARERAPCFSSYFFWKLCDLPCNRERTFASTILQAARCGKMTEARSFSNSGRQTRQLSVCWLSIFCSKKESVGKSNNSVTEERKPPHLGSMPEVSFPPCTSGRGNTKPVRLDERCTIPSNVPTREEALRWDLCPS